MGKVTINETQLKALIAESVKKALKEALVRPQGQGETNPGYEMKKYPGVQTPTPIQTLNNMYEKFDRAYNMTAKEMNELLSVPELKKKFLVSADAKKCKKRLLMAMLKLNKTLAALEKANKKPSPTTGLVGPTTGLREQTNAAGLAEKEYKAINPKSYTRLLTLVALLTNQANAVIAAAARFAKGGVITVDEAWSISDDVYQKVNGYFNKVIGKGQPARPQPKAPAIPSDQLVTV